MKIDNKWVFLHRIISKKARSNKGSAENVHYFKFQSFRMGEYLNRGTEKRAIRNILNAFT